MRSWVTLKVFLGDTKSLYKTSFLLAFGGSYNDYVTPCIPLQGDHPFRGATRALHQVSRLTWGIPPVEVGIRFSHYFTRFWNTSKRWLVGIGISEPSTVPGLLKWFHNVHGWLGHEILVNFLEWSIFRCDYCHLLVLGRVSFDTIWLFPNISTWDQSQRTTHNMICLGWTKTLQQLRYAGMVKRLFVLEYVPLPYHLV